MVAIKSLVETIIEKTRTGKLLWSDLAGGAFLANIGDNSAVISRKGNHYCLDFRDANGRILDRMLEEIEIEPPEHDESTLSNLYEVVRRQALKVDETLMEIKRNLDTL